MLITIISLSVLLGLFAGMTLLRFRKPSSANADMIVSQLQTLDARRPTIRKGKDTAPHTGTATTTLPCG